MSTTPENTVELLAAPDRDVVAAELTAEFENAYGEAPQGVWSAPGRVNLIGEHVDYTGGLCLPFALPHRTSVALTLRQDDRIRLRSRQSDDVFDGRLADVGPNRPAGWVAYAAGVAWALGVGRGFDAVVDGHVPLGSGLSSSAALSCSVGVALADLTGLPLDDAGRAMLAGACVQAENVVAGANTGGLDQSASLRCREGAGILLDCRDGSAHQIPLDLAGAGLEILVIDTRAEHSHSGGEYGERRAAVEECARLLGVPTLREVDPADLDRALDRVGTEPGGAVLQQRLRHVVTEIDRVSRAADLLRGNDLRTVADQLGALLDGSHESLRHDYQVTCTELDLAVDTARAAGALGARMTGGGFGGSAIALLSAGTSAAVAARVGTAFADAGLRAPQFLAAVPAAGAGRDR
ncbi:galactokinase [Kineococcus gynurae]|uniref:Galactokinase n=1 Tax=Kineococcus gynurae TaxID=452979 RepID=A0ABV5LT54_9ACTN